MIKRYFYPEGRVDFHAVLALSMSILSGLAAAGLAIIVNEAAGEIIEGRVHLRHLPYFIIDTIVLIASRRIGLRQGIELVERFLEKQRNRLGNLIRQAELRQLEKMDKGEIYLKITVNTQIISLASQSVIRVFQSIITIFFIFGYIFHLSKGIGILFMSLFALGVAFHRWHRKGFEEKNHKALQLDEALFDQFGQAIRGFKELKMNHAKNTDFLGNTLKPADQSARLTRIELGEMRAKYDTISFIFLFYISLGSVAFLLPIHTALALKFKIVTASAFLWEPISVLSLALPEILKARAAAEELETLEKGLTPLDGVTELLHDPDTEVLEEPQEIRISQLCFDYLDKDGEVVFKLGPMDLSIQKGETIFIVGGNGSGKSTFLKVLTGLYPPVSGSFFIDGAEITLSDHSYLFSAVYADFHLFDRLYGIDIVDEKRLSTLLNQMSLDHLVRWKEGKFVYEGLSSGQMKRLALVASLLEEKPIYIFDEWAAEQDPEFKKYFYEQLLPEMKTQGKTVIAATHDERYFHGANRLITMEYGRIIHEGLPGQP